MGFREVTDIQLDAPATQASPQANAAPIYREVKDIQLDAPQEQPSLTSKAGSVLARTGRIATGIVGAAADLPVVAAQSAYDTTRSLQDMSNKAGFGGNLPGQVSPAYKIPLPSNTLKNAYDSATGGAGKATGTAGEIDQAAELVPAAFAAPGIAKMGVNAVTKAVAPNVEGVTKALAQRAKDFGIPLSVNQVAPSRVKNTVQKISQEIPFSGVDKFEETQTKAFNKALAKTIGQDADNLGTDTIKKFLVSANEKFRTTLTGEQINIPEASVAKLKGMKETITRQVDASLAKVVQNNIDDVLAQIESKDVTTGILDASGNAITKAKSAAVSGEKLASIRSVLMDNAASASGGAKNALNKAVGVIDDIAAQNLSEEKAQELAVARREWRNFKTIQPLIKKSTDGNINPTQLINRIGNTNRYVKSEIAGVGQDDLVDLARIGKQFLAKKGGSDTLQKGAFIGAGGTLAATNPLLAAKIGAGVAANRGYQEINQSQKLINAALGARGASNKISSPLLTLATGSLVPRDNN